MNDGSMLTFVDAFSISIMTARNFVMVKELFIWVKVGVVPCAERQIVKLLGVFPFISSYDIFLY
jgi:hypothetical protein